VFVFESQKNDGRWTTEEKARLADGMSRGLDRAQLVEIVRTRTPSQASFLYFPNLIE
jgi:hypothetical protein